MSYYKKKKKFKKSSTKLKSLKKNNFNLLKTINSLMRRRKIWRLAIQTKMPKLKNFKRKKQKRIKKLPKSKSR